MMDTDMLKKATSNNPHEQMMMDDYEQQQYGQPTGPVYPSGDQTPEYMTPQDPREM